MENKELVNIEQREEVRSFVKNAEKAVAYAEKLVVNSEESESSAIKARARVKEERSRGDSIRKFFTEPLNEQVKRINAIFMPNIKLFDEADQILSRKMGDYQTKLAQEAEAKKAKVMKDLEAGKIKNVEKAVEKIENIKEPEKTVRQDIGTTTYRDFPVVTVVDASKLPREFLMPDMKKIEAVAVANHKAGIAQIPGVEVKVEKRPSFRRN